MDFSLKTFLPKGETYLQESLGRGLLGPENCPDTSCALWSLCILEFLAGISFSLQVLVSPLSLRTLYSPDKRGKGSRFQEQGKGKKVCLGLENGWLELGSQPRMKVLALALSVAQMRASRNTSPEPGTATSGSHCTFSLCRVCTASSPSCWSGYQSTAQKEITLYLETR